MSPGPCAKDQHGTGEGFLRALPFSLFAPTIGFVSLFRGFAQIRARLRMYIQLPRTPIRTGWNRTAAAIVHSSANAINLPMLDMPG
jgi:hypothetical protein